MKGRGTIFIYNIMKWSENEIEIIKNYDSKNELLNLIKGRSWNSIRKKRNKVTPNNVKKCKKWTKEEIDIIIENYEKLEKEKLMNLLPNRSWDSIKLKSNSVGINRSYDFLRDSKMEILLKNELETFYWIGFILADGHINDKIRLALTLSCKDIEHLIKFSKYIECDNIQIDDIKCTITLQNKEVCPVICDKFDIKSDKTYDPPNFKLFKFDKELIFSLIIGFIDGDGCIGKVYKRKDCNLRIHLHNSWINNLIFIENFIYQYFEVSKNKTLSKISNDGYSLLSISNSEVLNRIKKECIRLKLPIMYRKWNNIDENRNSRNILFKEIKSEILKLYKDGISPKDIIKKLNLNKGVVYKHIRNYNKVQHF
jgi:hypothetical protein